MKNIVCISSVALLLVGVSSVDSSEDNRSLRLRLFGNDKDETDMMMTSRDGSDSSSSSTSTFSSSTPRGDGSVGGLLATMFATNRDERRSERQDGQQRTSGLGNGRADEPQTKDGRTTCRKKGLPPHMQALWQAGFPSTGFEKDVTSLCEGSVTLGGDNSICTSGRVNYGQIAKVAKEQGRYIRAPASSDITVPGHLTAGSSNMVLGSEAFLAYDFIANYTVEGTTYTADSSMANNLLAASRGAITNVCFLPSFSATESFYSIKHDFWLPISTSVDFTRATNANILYFGFFSVVAEYHAVVDTAPVITGHFNLFLITLAAAIVPSSVFNVIPFLGLTGIFRLFTVGTMSTAKYPQPLDAPPVTVEGVQLNTEWTTLIAAAEQGLFTDGNKKVPLYFGVFIKKIQPSSSGNACWNVEQAAIDFQAPKGKGDQLDTYINDQVLPALQAVGGTVDLSMGKRLDSGSSLLSAALSRYNSQCGVEVNIEPTNGACYHPACRRSSNIDDFTYPSDYYI